MYYNEFKFQRKSFVTNDVIHLADDQDSLPWKSSHLGAIGTASANQNQASA